MMMMKRKQTDDDHDMKSRLGEKNRKEANFAPLLSM